MKTDDRDLSYLWDMREAASRVMEFIGENTYWDFENNFLLQSAVERQLEIIGEAAKRVSDGFQTDHNDIPWRQIIGLRNILAHEYGEIRSDRIWLVATGEIPKLVNQLNRWIQ